MINFAVTAPIMTLWAQINYTIYVVCILVIACTAENDIIKQYCLHCDLHVETCDFLSITEKNINVLKMVYKTRTNYFFCASVHTKRKINPYIGHDLSCR